MRRMPGSLDHLVLKVVKDLHGYGYGKTIADRFNAETSSAVSVNNICSILRRLERDGLIFSRLDNRRFTGYHAPRKRFYALAVDGDDRI